MRLLKILKAPGPLKNISELSLSNFFISTLLSGGKQKQRQTPRWHLVVATERARPEQILRMPLLKLFLRLKNKVSSALSEEEVPDT